MTSTNPTATSAHATSRHGCGVTQGIGAGQRPPIARHPRAQPSSPAPYPAKSEIPGITLAGFVRPFVFGDDLADSRHQLRRTLHECMVWAGQRGLMLGGGLLVRLALVMVQEPPDPGVIPAWWKLTLLRGHGHIRLRRRYAARAFPLRSYAVTTNAPRRSWSST